MLFQKLHTILTHFESQSELRISGYGRSVVQLNILILLYKTLLTELLELEDTYIFSSTEEEIRYYKYEKTKFLKYGFYYGTLYDLEVWIPIGSIELKNDYYQKALNDLNKFYIQHQEMVVYMRMNRCDNDSIIFVKNSPNNHIFAIIEATIMMERFLNNVDDAREAEERIKNFPLITWTGTLASLVLMIKALVLSKSINNGNVTIVELVNYFQVMFNVDLKDHYRKYNEIKNSKEPTKFLDYLIELIEKDIDEGEEKLIKKRIRK